MREAGRAAEYSHTTVSQGHLCLVHPSAFFDQRHSRPLRDWSWAEGVGVDGLWSPHWRCPTTFWAKQSDLAPCGVAELSFRKPSSG